MKKYLKIILITSAIIVAFVVFYGYNVYQIISGNEKLTGSQTNIPTKVKEGSIVETSETDWPNWRGKNFDGKSQTRGIKRDWTNGLTKLWELDYLCQGNGTASWSAAVIKGNRLIVPGRDLENDLLFCINADNGNLIWTGKYPAEAETSHGPGPRATPFIDSNFVYTFGRSGDVVCWQLTNGKLLWRKNVKEIGGIEPTWGYSTTPLVIDNKVIVQGGGTALIIAYNKRTGDILWKSLEGEVGYSASIPVIIEGTKLLMVYHGTALSCLNPETGKEIWRIPWATDYFVNATTPAIEGNILFHTSGYDMGCEAIELSKDSYKLLWKNATMSAQHSDPIIIDGFIYGYSGQATSNKGQFKCIELKTGKELWSTNEIGQGTSTYVDGHLICLDLKGNLYLLKPNPSKFTKIGEINGAIPNVKSLSWTVPVVANGKLFLRYMQSLICYDLVK